jgi:hypothetical protein
MSDSAVTSIILPMNPHGDYYGGSTPGSIIAQKWFADRNGKVIISFAKGCRYANSQEKPPLGFFYDTSAGRVTHRFSVVDITDDRGISRYEKEFLPPWRRELRESKLERGEQRTWILIENIFRLRKPKEMSDFGIKRCRSLTYSSKGMVFSYAEENQSPDDFIDEIVFRCATSATAKFTEDDLELIMWAMMVKNDAKYLQRQRSYEDRKRKKLRLDILMRTKKGEYVVIELKRETATKEALENQLRLYMSKVANEFSLTRVKGIIVARNVSPDLQKALMQPENADIRFARYGFAFCAGSMEKILFH